MQHRNESNQQENDSKVYKKLSSGQSLTSEDLALILDGNSIDNVVKQKYENAALNEELNEYFKEKRELQQTALENTLSGIVEYMWRKEYESQQIVEAEKHKSTDALEDFYSEEYFIMDASSEKDWMNNLIKNMFPEHEHIHMREQLSKVEEIAEKSGLKVDVPRTMIAVLALANQSPTLKAFLFSDKNPEGVAERILHVGQHLKNIDFRGTEENIKPYLDKMEEKFSEKKQARFKPN